MKSFFAGLLIGGMLTYIAFQSHIVQTPSGVVFVPKQPAIPLSDTYVDIRTWGQAEWAEHPRIYEAMKAADRLPSANPQEQTSPGETPQNGPVQLRGPARQQNARSVSYPDQTSVRQVAPNSEQGQRPPVATTPPIRRLADATSDMMQESARSIDAEVESFENDFLQELDKVFMESRQGITDGVDRSRSRLGGDQTGASDSNESASSPRSSFNSEVRPFR